MKTRAVSWFVIASLTLNNPCYANPTGGSVVGGDGNATINGSGTPITTINQHGNRVVINWQNFSIGAGEVTRFVQPSASSWALNRVISGNPSLIYGSLQANGHVMVINPNGILVGAAGRIDTKGFYASTLDIKDSTFMKGGALTLSGDSTASVRNEGTISALGGDVFLIGNTVENSGTISAPQGTVGLAAGSTVRLVQSGNERISVLAGNPNGAAANGVHNLGTIEGASAELKAAGGNIYALAINNEGVIRANSIVNEGGHIYLRASGGNIENSGTLSAHNADGSGGTVIMDGGHYADLPSTVVNSGTIEARGDAAGTKGGRVVMTGDHVGLFDHAVVDVSGDSGGGTALIGGDYHGNNPNIQNADRTFVSADTIVRADGLSLGDGGKVVIWSDSITRFNGTISAQGGVLGGNGGFVETSSGNSLLFNGSVGTLAPAGHGGTLLLDPKNIFITAAGTDPVAANDQFGENAGADANMSAASVIAALAANATLTLQANNDIAIETDLNFTLNGATANHNFTLEAGRHIIFAQTPNFTTPSSSSGGVTLTMNGGNFTATYNDQNVPVAQQVNRDAGTAEFFMSSGSSILTLGGNINITGGTLVGAAGNATLATLTTTGPANTSGNPGGNITINTGAGGGGGDINAGTITTAGAALTSGNGAGNDGGTVNLTGGNVSIGSIDSSGSDGRSTGPSPNHNAGAGGGVTILSGGTLAISGGVTTSGGNGTGTGDGGTGGAVNLTAGTSASVNAITATGGIGAPGHAGGNITIGAGTTLTLSGALTSSGGNGQVAANQAGNAGDINLTASGGALTVNSSITANGGGSGAGNAGNAGDVTLNGSSIGLNGSISAAAGNPSGGTVGTITLNATAGGVSQTAGSLSAANLVLAGAGVFDLNRSGNDVQTLSGTVNGNVSYSDANDLAIGGLDAGANSVTLTVLGAGNRLTVNAATTLHGDGGISLNADRMTLTGSTINGGTAIVSLRPQHGGAINLGSGSESGGALGLLNGELSTVHAGVLRIGDASSGNITIDGAIAPANTSTLSLQSGGSISQSTPGNTITVGNLALRAGTTITLNSANDVGTLAASAGGAIQYKDANALSIGAVDGLNGVSAVNSAITIATTTGNLTVNNTAAVNDVNAGNSTVNLNAGGAVLTIGSGANVNGDAGVTLTADNMDLQGTVSTLGVALLRGSTLGRQITLGTGGVGTLSLSSTEINNISAGTLKIGDSSSGDITINDAIHPVAANLSLESGGNISEVAGGSLIVDGLTTLKTPGDITLDQVGNDFSRVVVTAGNDVTIRDDNAIVLGDSTAGPFTITGDLTVTAGGNISENDALLVSGVGQTASFTLTAGADVLLGNQANNFRAVSISGPVNNLDLRNVTTAAATAGTLTLPTTVNNLTLTYNNAAIDLPGVTVNGNLSVTAGGAITDNGDVRVTTGTTTLTAGSGNDITLDNNDDFGGAVSIVSGRNVTLNDINGIDLGASTMSGDLKVTAAGNITDSGDVRVTTGTTTLAAGSGNDITLDNNDDFSGAVSIVSGRNVTLNDINAIDLGASTVSGTLKVTAAGNITDSGDVKVTGTTTLTAGGNDITLDNNDDFGGAVSIVSGHNVTLNDVNAINLGDSTVSGTLNVTAQGITDSGVLNVVSGPSFFSISTVANGNVILDSANHFGNQTVTIGGVNGGTVGNVTFRNIDGNAVFPTLPANFGSLTVQFDTAPITITVPFILSGSLTLTAGGLISQTAAFGVSGSTTLSAGLGNDINLGLGNDFGGAVNIVSGANVTLNDINGLTVGGNLGGNLVTTAGGPIAFNTLSVGGNLNATGIGLSDNGDVSITGTSTLNAGGADISFTHNDNFGGAVTVANANNATLNDINALTVGGNVNGNFTATAGGPIAFNTLSVGGNLSATGNGLSDNGDVSITGTSALNAGGGDISFTHNDNFGGAVTVANANNVTLNDVNNLTVGGSLGGNLIATAVGPIAFNTLSVGGNLTATGNGLSDNGDVSITGTSALNAGGGDISFIHNDNFGGAVTLANVNNATLNDINALTVGGNVNGTLTTTAGGATTFNPLTVGGNLNTTAGGPIVFNALTVGGNLTATGNGLSDNDNVHITGTSALNGGGGDISFTHADDFGGAVTVANANNVTLNDVNSLTVGGNANGNLSATAAGPIAFNTLSVGGNLTATGNGLSDNGDVSITGTSALNAGGNDISFTHNDNFGGAVSIANANNVSLTDVNAIDLGASTVSGTLTVTAGGNISDSGPLLVTGNAIFKTAGGNDIILDNSGNTFNGSVTFGSTDANHLNNVTVVDTTAFDINAITVDGAFSVTSGGQVTQSGDIHAGSLGVTSAGSVTLFSSGNQVGTLAIDAQGTVQYRDADSVTIGSVNGVNGINSHDNNVTVTTVSGDITVANTTAPTDVDAGSGTLVFTAGGSDKTITIAAGASVHAEGGNATTPAITFNADNMNIAGTLDAGGPTGKDILLQAVSPHRNLHFAANNTADTGGELSFNQDELNNIHAHTLTIGNTAAGDINGIGTVSKPGTVEIFRVIGGSSSVSVQAFASQFASFLSGTALPTPRLEVTTFSGAAIDLDEASKIMEPNAIGTLFLQVPFVPVNEAKYRIEEGSKWTTGRIAASGTTAGPQTPR